jgi:small subunit ribosomal protein S5
MKKIFMAKERRGSREVVVPSEFDQKIIDLSRVTRVMAGGKRMRFRACVVIGDRRGRVGWAVAKAADVSEAVSKAATKAKKHLLTIPLYKNTIAHEVVAKYKASEILLKPAKEGVGLIAGGSVRSVLELAGVPNIYAKMIGRTANSINNITAIFQAIKILKSSANRKKAGFAETTSDPEATKSENKKQDNRVNNN